MNFYEILGVSRDANRSTIDRAYRRLAGQYHPDSSQGETAEQMAQINEAYQCLKDPQRRQFYDQYGEAPRAGVTWKPESEFSNDPNDESAYSLILMIFQSYMNDCDQDIDFAAAIRKEIKKVVNDTARLLADARKRLERLEKRQQKLDPTKSLIAKQLHRRLSAMVENQRHSVVDLENRLGQASRALEIAKDLDFNCEPESGPQYRSFGGTSFGTTTGFYTQ